MNWCRPGDCSDTFFENGAHQRNSCGWCATSWSDYFLWVWLFIYIHLYWMQKTKLRAEWIVVLVDTIWGKICCEQGVKIIILAIIKSKEVFREMAESLRDAWVDGEVKAHQWKGLISSFLHIFILKLSNWTRASRGL